MFFFLVKKSCVNFGQNHSVSISWKDQWDIRLYTKKCLSVQEKQHEGRHNGGGDIWQKPHHLLKTFKGMP